MLSLGSQPLANALVDDPSIPEQRYPLDLAMCSSCGLAQLTVSVDPSLLFTHYPYLSGYSSIGLAHAESLARRTIDGRGLGAEDLVVEIASNDGSLLQHYVRAGVPVLGFDPASTVQEAAAARGVRTRQDFFSADVGAALRDEGVRAAVIHANNVLAHVPDVRGVVRGMQRVLADDGIVIIETPSLRALVDRVAFDTIYHEHLFVYSLTSLTALLEGEGLRIVEVEALDIHGGSLRVTAAREGEPSADVVAMLDEEHALGVAQPTFLMGLAERMTLAGKDLRAELARRIDDGQTIAAYGAAAKGTVLCNAFGIGTQTITWVADRNPLKQGRFMPGVHIPIVDTARLLEEQPDAVLLLAWNLAAEVMDQQADYLACGGSFILPVPLEVVTT